MIFRRQVKGFLIILHTTKHKSVKQLSAVIPDIGVTAFFHSTRKCIFTYLSQYIYIDCIVEMQLHKILKINFSNTTSLVVFGLYTLSMPMKLEVK